LLSQTKFYIADKRNEAEKMDCTLDHITDWWQMQLHCWQKKWSRENGLYSWSHNRLVTNATSLTLTLLTWRIWWAPNNASRWQTWFNSVFKGLNARHFKCTELQLESTNGRKHFKKISVYWNESQKRDKRMWTQFTCIRMESSAALLWP